MAANDSGLDTSNDSNDGLSTATGGIMITRPPIIPPTPASSPNTHGDWPPHISPGAFQLNIGEHFALPRLPPLPPPLNPSDDFLPATSTLPSSSHSLKMRPRTMTKHRSHFHSSILAESKGRKLRTAASTCNLELLNRILESGCDPNAADEYKRSPLHLASCRGYIQIVEQLLKFGANPNVVDSLGNTPLHLAVISASSNNFNAVVRILLQSGASVHTHDRSGKSPLELAEAKLRLLRSRHDHPTPETAKILDDMRTLTTLILRYTVNQKRETDDLTPLEKRLKDLIF